MSLISLCIIERDPECERDDAGDHLGRAARAGDAGEGVVAVPAVPCQGCPRRCSPYLSILATSLQDASCALPVQQAVGVRASLLLESGMRI